MAYEYYRLEREDNSGSFLMGLLAGTVLGAGLGMLFAPKSGTELRSQLSESAGRIRSTAGDSYQQASEKVAQASEQVTTKVSQMVDKGRDAYDRARSSVQTGVASATETANTMLGGQTPPASGTGGPMSGAGTGYTPNRS